MVLEWYLEERLDLNGYISILFQNIALNSESSPSIIGFDNFVEEICIMNSFVSNFDRLINHSCISRTDAII